jgi:hypothetical protein
LLQSTYGDNQIGSFENFHQFGENALVVLGSWFEVFLQYALRFVDGLKNQLLIGHAFLPIQFRRVRGKRKIKSFFGIIPSTFVSRGNLDHRTDPRTHLGERSLPMSRQIKHWNAAWVRPTLSLPFWNWLHVIRAIGAIFWNDYRNVCVGYAAENLASYNEDNAGSISKPYTTQSSRTKRPIPPDMTITFSISVSAFAPADSLRCRARRRRGVAAGASVVSRPRISACNGSRKIAAKRLRDF